MDVFFVLSGFLITSLLLREVHVSGRPPSIRSFYARRMRRLLPAAVLVTVVTVVWAYASLGFIRGDQVATDARWTSAFAGNIHFALIGTDYLGSQDLPSPLQHFWSLGVEEQFYVVWPWIFILIVVLCRGVRLRLTLGVALLTILVVSLIWSYVQTDSNGTWAYFSPLTRAWELAAGALLAVGTPLLSQFPARLAAVATWVGLAGILAAAALYDSGTPFPGVAAIVPVAATVLVIAGGAVPHRASAGWILRAPPFQWLGRLSYSFYLWHWPLLIIPAQIAGAALAFSANLALLGIALLLSAVTYLIVERPVRFSVFLSTRPLTSIAAGAVLAIGSIALSSWAIARHSLF